MPIDKYYEFICDNCGQGCYLTQSDRQSAIYKAKQAGVIVKGGKYILCNKKCLRKWEKNNV